MSNMPANIWAKTGYGCKATGYWHDEPILPNQPQNAGTEYTRTDLHRAEIEAAVKRAIEACDMAVCSQAAPIAGTPYSAGPRVFSDAIRAIASDPAAIEAIVKGPSHE